MRTLPCVGNNTAHNPIIFLRINVCAHAEKKESQSFPLILDAERRTTLCREEKGPGNNTPWEQRKGWGATNPQSHIMRGNCMFEGRETGRACTYRVVFLTVGQAHGVIVLGVEHGQAEVLLADLGLELASLLVVLELHNLHTQLMIECRRVYTCE